MKKFIGNIGVGIVCVVGLLFTSCSSPKDTPNSSDLNSNSSQKTTSRSSGTVRMVRRLKEINSNAVPQLNYHLNSRRATEILAAIKGKSRAETIQLHFNYALELLNSGQTEAAITSLEQLLGNPDEYQINDANRLVFEILAVAYLRRGEQQNCIANHSPQSCIVPISGSGVHVFPASSRKAIEVYQAILKSKPEDLQSRWLLNLAHMTLGEYPDQVAEQWLINGLSQTDHEFPRFTDIAMNAGLAVTGLSGGVCMEDFNNDGHLDIFCSSYGLDHQVRLFFSNADGTFREATKAAGLTGIVSGLNTIHGDYNNDGFVDILILRGAWLRKAGTHPNSLLENNGDGTFEDVTFDAGLTGEHPTQTAAFADFNLDGWLDVFVGNESTKDDPHPCQLFMNNRDGTFQEVANSLGLNYVGYVKGVLWGDFDNDNLPDLFISELMGNNKLYKNQGGNSIQDWKFKDVTATAGVEAPLFSFPGWFWDYNNDGWQDLFVAAYQMDREGLVGEDYAAELLGKPVETELSRLYENNGDGTFSDVTDKMQVNRVMYAMGSNFGDLDNDGWQDFYVGTGAPDLRSVIPNRMFWNRPEHPFEEVTFSGGFGHIQKGHGVAFGDLDHDGDQDIYCVMGGAFEGDVFQNVLYENPGNANRWITLQLQGTKSNRSAISARVCVKVDTHDGGSREIHRTVRTGGSFGASSLQLEIGLGDAIKISEIRVLWPTKIDNAQTFRNVDMDRSYRIIEGKPELITLERKPFKFKPHQKQ